MTTTSETAFTHSAEAVYDFVTNPANWTKTYPGSERIGKLPEVPLKVGDTWEESGGGHEFVLRWRRPIVQHRLVQELEYNRWSRAVGRSLCHARSQCCTGAATRNGQPNGIDAEVGPVSSGPVEHSARVVKRRGIRMLRSQAVIDRDHGATPAAREFQALTVIGIKISEDERAGVAVDDSRSG